MDSGIGNYTPWRYEIMTGECRAHGPFVCSKVWRIKDRILGFGCERCYEERRLEEQTAAKLERMQVHARVRRAALLDASRLGLRFARQLSTTS